MCLSSIERKYLVLEARLIVILNLELDFKGLGALALEGVGVGDEVEEIVLGVVEDLRLDGDSTLVEPFRCDTLVGASVIPNLRLGVGGPTGESVSDVRRGVFAVRLPGTSEDSGIRRTRPEVVSGETQEREVSTLANLEVEGRHRVLEVEVESIALVFAETETPLSLLRPVPADISDMLTGSLTLALDGNVVLIVAVGFAGLSLRWLWGTRLSGSLRVAREVVPRAGRATTTTTVSALDLSWGQGSQTSGHAGSVGAMLHSTLAEGGPTVERRSRSSELRDSEQKNDKDRLRLEHNERP